MAVSLSNPTSANYGSAAAYCLYPGPAPRPSTLIEDQPISPAGADRFGGTLIFLGRAGPAICAHISAARKSETMTNG